MDVVKDLRLAREILEDMGDCYEYLDSGRLYLGTNEALSFIFSHFDFTGKDIYSVLASSDQVFSFYYLGANSVDTFDIHRLTEYYYYLRKWSLEQGCGAYPYVYSNSDLKKILSKVEPKFLQESYSKEFWGSLLSEYPGLMHSELFFMATSAEASPFLGDESHLLHFLPKEPLSFQSLDLFQPFSTDRTYDVVFVSNILEYARGDLKKLSICRDNLESLLRPDGFVIATNFMRSSVEESSPERRIFSSSFDFVLGEKKNSVIFSRPLDVYHVYQKKKS